jgi:uncharacterized protein DUF5666
MLRSSMKVALIGLALVLSCSQTPSGSSSGNAAIAGALDAASVAALRGQTLRVSVVGTPSATKADTSGRFALSGLSAGSASLRFEAQGIDSTLRVSGLVPKQTTRVSVRISGKNVTLVTGTNEAALVGTIDAIGTNTLTISGLEVDVDDQTRIVSRGATITFADLKVNEPVAVDGTLSDGKVLAKLVNLLLPANLDHVVLQGTIDSIASPDFVVSGLTIVTDPNTRFRRGLTFAGLQVGDHVAVQGTLQPDGTVLARVVRDLDAAAGQVIEVEGAITSITPPDHLVIAGVVTVVVNADTRIEAEGHHRHRGPGSGGRDLRTVPRSTSDHGDDDDGVPLTFDDLKVGDEVEVEGIAQADGTVLAMRIEVERNEAEIDDDD